MAQKIAVVSRHIVLSKARHPVYGLILIEDEVIQDIVAVDQSVPVFALIEKYSEWNPQDYEHFYISPGLIDCNVTSNGAWEGRLCMTKAAIAGGVTLVVEQPDIYQFSKEDGQLFCDVGQSFLVQPRNVRDLNAAIEAGVMAIKGYMSPPSAYVDGIEPVLSEIMEIAGRSKVPLFLDACDPNRRHIYMGSPCRYRYLEERLTFNLSDGGNYFAGAFPDEEENSDEEGDQILKDSPPRTASDVGNFNRRTSGNFDVRQENSPHTVIVPIPEEDEYILRTRGMTAVFNESDRPSKHPIKKSKDIYQDLDTRIKKTSYMIEDLADLEYSGYQASGPTLYETPLRRRSSSFSTVSVSIPVPPTDTKGRLQDFRPAALAIGHVKDEEPEEDSKDNVYLFHLANFPERWERRGVEKITELLKNIPCKLHFCNLSSADAVNRVRKFREASPSLSISCETCPHYLYWVSGEIPDGMTLLKASPPIRNRNNKLLLWELLKVKAVDMISSHHSPVHPDYKFVQSGSFRKALNGVTGLGFSLQAVWTRLLEETESKELQEHYIVRLAKWMSSAPAKLLGLSRTRGSIKRGKYADLVIWAPWEICTQDSQSKYPSMNPYCNEPLFGHVHHVFLRGHLVYTNGVFQPAGRMEYRPNNTLG